MVLEYLPTKVGDLCWANVGKYFKDVQRCSKMFKDVQSVLSA